jgi:hypothetical protein
LAFLWGAFLAAFFEDFFAAFFGITVRAAFLTFFTAVLVASFVACAASVTGFEEARKIGGSGAGEINRDGCFERAARFFG